MEMREDLRRLEGAQTRMNMIQEQCWLASRTVWTCFLTRLAATLE